MINKKVALVLLPLFWPNMPPLSLASLKGYLVKNSVGTRCLDLNNFFYNKVNDDLKRDWRKSCNTSLEEKVWDIMAVDCGEEFNGIVEDLLQYDIIGLSVYKSNLNTVMKFCGSIKQKNSKIKIVLGGPEISRKYFDLGMSMPEYFKGKADFFIIGEGERALLSFVKEENSDKDMAVHIEEPDLSDSSIPDYSDFDLNSYPRNNGVALLYSRGCVRKCAFCAERLLYKRFRIYPVQNIIDQIEKYRNKNIRQFVFHDSLINGDLEALEELCDSIISEFGYVEWEAQIAVRRDMPEDLFRKIKQSGCYHLFVGLESGSDNTLLKMNKGFTVSDAEKFFRKLNKYDISFGVSLIAGFPGETDQDFNDSVDFVVQNRDLIPRIEQINPFVYYDGIDLPDNADYKFRDISMKRARLFIDRIDKAGFKYTKAFMLNLVEQEWK